jgi:cell division protease FtsH
MIDEEIRAIIDRAYHQAETILKEHEAEVRQTAESLLEKEHLSGEEFAAIFAPKVEEAPAAEESAEPQE